MKTILRYLPLLFLSFFFIGCDSDNSNASDDLGDRQYLFTNEASVPVTIATEGGFTGSNPRVSILNPGEEVIHRGEQQGNEIRLNYDFSPQDTVIANEIAVDKILFTDRP